MFKLLNKFIKKGKDETEFYIMFIKIIYLKENQMDFIN